MENQDKVLASKLYKLILKISYIYMTLSISKVVPYILYHALAMSSLITNMHIKSYSGTTSRRDKGECFSNQFHEKNRVSLRFKLKCFG